MDRRNSAQRGAKRRGHGKESEALRVGTVLRALIQGQYLLRGCARLGSGAGNKRLTLGGIYDKPGRFGQCIRAKNSPRVSKIVWVQFSTELAVSRHRMIEPFIIAVTCSLVILDFPCANFGIFESICSWIEREAMQKSSVTYPSGDVTTPFLMPTKIEASSSSRRFKQEWAE